MSPPLEIVRITVKELCTPILRRFFLRHLNIIEFFLFNVSLASRTDEMRVTAARALASPGRKADEERLAEVERNPWPTMLRLRDFADLQAENLCIRAVDNFLSFLSETIQETIRRKPELLRSEETVRLDEIVRFKRYSDLIGYLVDKKMNELTYGGIRGIERFVEKRTGLSLFETSEERTLLMLAVELRNIFSHNRGVVTEITLKRLSGLNHSFSLKEGKRAYPNFDQIVLLSNNMATVARRLDGLFATKFSIRRKRYTPPSQAADVLERHLKLLGPARQV